MKTYEGGITMKRLLTIMAITALSCSMLMGCGDSDNGVTNDGTLNEQNEVQEDVTENDTTVDENQSVDDNTDTNQTEEESTDNGFATYKDETVWGRVTSVNENGFQMDVGILDDSNMFAVNDAKADVTINDDTDIKKTSMSDSMTLDKDLEDATLDDLKSGDLVAVEYDSNGEVDSVHLMVDSNE